MTEHEVNIAKNLFVVVRQTGTESSKPYMDLFVDVACILEFDGHLATMTIANPSNELWNIAKRNTLEGVVTQSLGDFLGIGNDEIEVVTNKLAYKGAGAIMFPEVFKDFCNRKGIDSCYVVPSSVHELLLVPTEMCSPEDINGMVNMVNVTEVAEEERLADHAYIYNTITNEVRPC